MDNAWGGLRAQLARRRVALGFVAAVAALIVARPTWTSWTLGLAVACAGEGIRVWAAGHIEKGREVTTSGPYRWMRHPLYVGSSVMALGRRDRGAQLVRSPCWRRLYMAATIAAAVTLGGGAPAPEVRRLPTTATRGAERAGVQRAFSLERAMRNREYRAVSGPGRRAS